MENMLDRLMVKESFDLIKKETKQKMLDHGIGCLFDNDETDLITDKINPEVLKNIYMPVNVFSDGRHYYLVNNENIMVSMGQIDIEGEIPTIEKDLTRFPTLYNITIAVVLDDEKYVEENVSADDILSFCIQALQGVQEVEKNKDFHNAN